MDVKRLFSCGCMAANRLADSASLCGWSDVSAHRFSGQYGCWPLISGQAKTHSVCWSNGNMRRQSRSARAIFGSKGNGFWDASVLSSPMTWCTTARLSLISKALMRNPFDFYQDDSKCIDRAGFL
jgi:hypothetical protein